MMKKLILVALFALCMVSPAFAAHANVTDCNVELGTSNTYYDVLNDLNFTEYSYGNCLYVTGQNQTIDCHGHNIDCEKTMNFGILANGNNTTIINCVFNYPYNAAIYTENNGVLFHVYNNTFRSHNASTCCDVAGNYGNDSINNASTFNDSTTGNFWSSPDGTLGYSDTCTNSNGDVFCDSPYHIFENTPLYDYFPLTNPYYQTGINLSVDGIQGNITSFYEFLNISAVGNYSGMNITLLRDGTLLNSSIDSVTFVDSPHYGIHNYTAYYGGNDTTSPSSATWFVTFNSTLQGCGVVLEGNVTYTLDSDLTIPYVHCWYPQQTNITIDGQGHTITGGQWVFNAYGGVAYDFKLRNTVFDGSGISVILGYGYVAEIYNNTFLNGGSVNCNYAGSCTVHDNYWNNVDTPVYVGQLTGAYVYNNTFINTVSQTWYYDYGASATFRDNHISGTPCVVYYGTYASHVGTFNAYNNIIDNYTSLICGSNYDGVYWNTTSQNGTRIINSTIWSTIGGNYYSDYSHECTDSDFDGYCDDPYVIGTNNVDYLPLKFAEIVCDDSELACIGNDLSQCHDGLGYDVIEECEDFCYNLRCTSVVGVILGESGTGFAGFMDAIAEPLMSPLLIFGVIASLLTIVYAIAVAVKVGLK